MNISKAISGAIFSLIFAANFGAAAEERPCVEAFRRAKTEFVERMAKLESAELSANVATGASGVAAVACMAARRTLMGSAICGTIFGATGLVAYSYSSTTRDKIRRLYDSYRLFSIYEARANNTLKTSKEAQSMMKDLGVDIQKEEKALEEFATLMEFSKLCEGDMPRTYEEAMGLMKKRLEEQKSKE